MSQATATVPVTSKVPVIPSSTMIWLWEIAVALAMAAFVALLYARLLFTNRVLASGDILLYFYPYRDYAAAALRSGDIPLWNPYIFLGVPFLANPQAAVLYPLHWPLSWLPVTSQIYWSAAIHTWLLGMGGYVLMRLWGQSRWAGLITGLVLAGSGFYGGLIGHLNQMNGAAWLPWALAVLVWEGRGEAERPHPNPPQVGEGIVPGRRTYSPSPDAEESHLRSVEVPTQQVGKGIVAPGQRSGSLPNLGRAGVGFSFSPRSLRAAGLFALLVALMLLAGHTQTVYINLFGLGVWVVWPLVVGVLPERVRKYLPRRFMRNLPGSPEASGKGVDTPPRHSDESARRNPLRTLTRTGGFLLLVGMTGRRLAVYGIGVVVGAVAAAPQLLPTLELSARGLRQGGLGYGEVSSFSLQPLRLLWTLLPSYGLVDLGVVFSTSGYTEFVAYVGIVALLLAALGVWRGHGVAWGSGLLLAVVGLFLAAGRWNPFYYLLYWVLPGFDLFRVPARWMMLYTLGMAILAGIGIELWLRGRGRVLALAVVGLVALDLILAARALPHTQTTAPQAVYDIRTALAHLLTDPARDALHPAAAGRFLGMSTITFDPGDMGDYARILRDGADPQLDSRAFEQLIIALKVQELLAPNLALLWRVPSLDGFDGGVLPLARYLDFLNLFVPSEQLITDGRLREQVKQVPPADLLAMFNVQYIITDKVRDLWFEDIYYDRQIGAQLNAEQPTVSVDVPHPFSSTHLHLIAAAEGDDAALAGASRPVVEVSVAGLDALDQAVTVQLPVLAGGEAGAHIADARLDSPLAATNGAVVAYQDVEGGRQEYRVSLELPTILTPVAITLTWQPDAPPVTVQAATLVDARTGMFTALLPSDRGRFQLVHSGDVKIYENLDLLPRAYLVHNVLAATDAEQAVALVAAGDFDPAEAAVVEGLAGFNTTAAPDDGATILSYTPERVVIESNSEQPALLVLSDGDDPGWQVTVDGALAPIYRTNVLLRGVAVPAGRHKVEFVYRPAAWQQGLWLGAAGWLPIAGLILGPTVWGKRLE